VYAPSGLATIGAVALQLVLVGAPTAAYGQTTQPATEVKRPALQVGSAARFNEDWSVLRGADLSTTGDVWDHVKFIPLNRDSTAWLTIGGQVRERGEYFRHFLFGDSQPEDTDAYLLTRFRLSADLHVTQYFRAFAEFKSSMELDRDLQGGSTGYVDQNDLLNGFADVMIPLGELASATLRGGRQELLFGSQRLVGPGDFSQLPKTFDGAAAYVRVRDWSVVPFWAMAVPIVHKYGFNKSTVDQQLFGIFATRPSAAVGLGPASGTLPPLPGEINLYWLGVNNATATFNGTSGREMRQTLGARTTGRVGQTGLDFDMEAAGQFGSVGSQAIAAGMVTALLGYTPAAAWLSPRVYLEFDYASGDQRPGGSVNTFNVLYPDAHSFLGYIDYIGRQNIISGNGGLIIHPTRDLSVSVQQYFFWRASDRDAIYNKSGGALRPGTGTRAWYVGAEIDLLATYNVTRHLQLYGGYSRFFTGEFIERTGPSKDSDFLYGAIQYTF
jgi:Alginate export